ncbi:MAG: CtpF protein [Parvibaculaceae bacterium]|nr:CtpF protein [Parvibaculaceae bacterium]
MSEAMPEQNDQGQDHMAMQVMKAVPRITVDVFCDVPQTAQVIQRASEDRRLAKAHVSVHPGGIIAAVTHFREAATPNLIIVESALSGEELFGELGALAQVCDAGTKVIIIGHLNDVSLYREMIRQGVNEYLVAPLAPMQIVEAISRLYVDPDAPPIGRSVAFIGARGGVGSSTIAHNIGWCVSENMREDATIVDMDISFGTVGLDFNQDPVQGIADALQQPERLDDVLLDRLLVKCTDRLSLFTAPAMLDKDTEMDADTCEAVIEVVRESCPCVIVDIPHVWAPWSKRLLANADEIVITASPDLASLRNTKNLVDTLKKMRENDAPPHVVLNQMGVPKRPEIPEKDFSEAIELELALTIPFIPALFGAAANNGQMIDEVDGKSKAANGLLNLASQVTGRQVPVRKGSSLLPFLGKLGGKK